MVILQQPGKIICGYFFAVKTPSGIKVQAQKKLIRIVRMSLNMLLKRCESNLISDLSLSPACNAIILFDMRRMTSLQTRNWSWHLLSDEKSGRVAKASKGHFPLPFLISNFKELAQM